VNPGSRGQAAGRVQRALLPLHRDQRSQVKGRMPLTRRSSASMAWVVSLDRIEVADGHQEAVLRAES